MNDVKKNLMRLMNAINVNAELHLTAFTSSNSLILKLILMRKSNAIFSKRVGSVPMVIVNCLLLCCISVTCESPASSYYDTLLRQYMLSCTHDAVLVSL